MTPQQKEPLKIRPKIEIDADGPLLKTRLVKTKCNLRKEVELDNQDTLKSLESI